VVKSDITIGGFIASSFDYLFFITIPFIIVINIRHPRRASYSFSFHLIFPLNWGLSFVYFRASPGFSSPLLGQLFGDLVFGVM